MSNGITFFRPNYSWLHGKCPECGIIFKSQQENTTMLDAPEVLGLFIYDTKSFAPSTDNKAIYEG